MLVPCAALELIVGGTVMVLNMSWQWDPAQGDVHPDPKVRWLAEEEIQSGQAVKTEDGHRMYRLRLKKEDFLVHGFTEGCPGFQAIVAGTTASGHSEACRSRMESALDKTDDGRQRWEKQELKENEALARKLQEEDERMTKKAMTGDDVPARCASAVAASSSSSKRRADVEEEDDVNDESKPPFAKRHRGLQNSRCERRKLDNEDMRGDDCQDEERPHKYMAITNMEENPHLGDMKWTVSEVSDMCIPDDPLWMTWPTLMRTRGRFWISNWSKRRRRQKSQGSRRWAFTLT